MLNDLLHLLYPHTCVCCEKVLLAKEEQLCISCRHQLPLLAKGDTLPWRTLAGRIQLSQVFGYLKFSKSGKVQTLLHEMKYRHNPELGVFLGREFGRALLSGNEPVEATTLMPVPLHPQKLMERGYNQAESIARGLSEILHLPISTTSLMRHKQSPTQTKKGRSGRLENMRECFAPVGEMIAPAGIHVALVDDVMTTGATLEACYECLVKSGFRQISILTLAVS